MTRQRLRSSARSLVTPRTLAAAVVAAIGMVFVAGRAPIDASATQAAWQPARGPLTTRWTAQVTPDAVLPEYPRPQLVREQWLTLNGLWEYAIRPKGEKQPASWDGRILVPFAAESALSGVMKPVGTANRLWYRRTFTPKPEWNGQRLLLHFGAVDWDSTVFVNGQQVGTHTGGYDPFTFDITAAVKAGAANEIVVSVWDPTDEGEQPRGKQVTKPQGIWYTAVTGIWQTVWIEPVPERFVQRLAITPDAARDRVRIEVTMGGGSGSSTTGTGAGGPRGSSPSGSSGGAAVVDLRILGKDGKAVAERYASPVDQPIELAMPNATRWSTTNPYLYNVELTLRGATQTRGGDRLRSYFGMRTIETRPDARGVSRLYLNGEPLFQLGLLDQGWWPDGLYTAPTDEALKYDLEVTKQLGFNMVRKHVKVEPARWYYWCDTLGLIVWQDMPSAFRGGTERIQKPGTAEGHAQFERELKAMIGALANHPSIVMWVPFNEAWGQYDTVRIAEATRALDPTRLVNESSGWDNYGGGDVRDVHQYPGPSMPILEDRRAAVLGEFGGLGLIVDQHVWQLDANWGYRSYKTRAELNDQYVARTEALKPLIAAGLGAAIYTQTTDVEIEVNGVMTYDRAEIKLDRDRVRALHESLYRPPPPAEVVLISAMSSNASWRATTTAPAATWMQQGFDDAAWQPRGATERTPAEGRSRAERAKSWTAGEVWLRRTFELSGPPAPGTLYLFLRHDEDATVYVNGRQIAAPTGSSSQFGPIEADAALRAALVTGTNVIAVHGVEKRGPQTVDAAIVSVAAPPPASR